MSSLKNRLSLGLMCSLITLLMAQWWFSSQAIERLLMRQQTDQLRHDSESILAGLHSLPGQPLGFDAERLNPDYKRPFSGSYYALRLAGHALSSDSWWDFQYTPPSVSAGQQQVLQQVGPDGQALLVFIAGYRKQGQLVEVAVAHDVSDLQANLWAYQRANAALSLLALLVLLFIQRWIVVRSLRALIELKSGIHQLQKGEVRQLSFQGPSEVQPVVDELNRLLLLVESRLKRSRQGMGNLAHGLKTRLARLSQLAGEPNRADEFNHEVQALAQDAARLVDRETARLRIVGTLRPSQPVPLLMVVRGLVQSCNALYGHKTVEPSIQVAENLAMQWDKEDLYELLGNLLDNAYKWSAGRITISADEHELRISDDGPGCTTEALKNLSTRGYRADEQVHGSGLGLAIAQDIAHSYGTTLRFESPGVLGGFDVLMRLQAPVQVD